MALAPYKGRSPSGAGGIPSPLRGAIVASGGDFQELNDSEHSETREEKRARIKSENLHECCSICCFAMFLLTFTLALLLEQSSQSSRLADHIRASLDGGAFPLKEVTTLEKYYDYLERGFIPAMYKETTDVTLAREESPALHPIDVSNRILGTPRLRQVRVQKTSDCQVSPMFSEYSISCFPVFSAALEDKDPFGPEGKYTWKGDDTGRAYSGSLSSYGPGGYIVYLSTNRSTAHQTAVQLRNDNFLGPTTRAVFADFSVWSSNVGSYAVVVVAAEFGPSGRVITSVKVLILAQLSLTFGGFGGDSEEASVAFGIILMLFVVYYMTEELREIWPISVQSIQEYLSDGWNVMDWTNMLLLLVQYIYRIMIWSSASSLNIGAAQLRNKDGYQNLVDLAENVVTIRSINAVNNLLLWAKCMKYLRNVPLIKELVRALWTSMSLLMPFLGMFGIGFFGFAMAYNIGFGDKLYDLADFERGIVYLARAFLKDVQMMPVYHVSPVFGAGMILVFYVVMLLVATIFVLAIFADALHRWKFDPKDTTDDDLHEDEPVEEFYRLVVGAFWKCLKAIAPSLYFVLSGEKKKRERMMQRRAAQAAGEEASPGDDNDSGGSRKALQDKPSQSSGFGFARRPALQDDFSPRDSLPDEDLREKKVTRQSLMRAIEHMSGRVISEISVVGIEIKTELHDICEQVAHMQMAVEELTQRTDNVRAAQEQVLKPH